MSSPVELDQDELKLLEASYRLVTDASAFDDVVAHWAKRLDRVDAEAIDEVEHPLLKMHMQSVSDMLEATYEKQANDPIFQAIGSFASPAVVVSAGGKVVAANGQAVTTWGLQQGQSAGTSWIEPYSVSTYEALVGGARAGGNRNHSIIRTLSSDGQSGIAEIYTMASKDRPGLVAVRALELTWSTQISNMLEQAFGLTAAEIEVCRLLMELRDTKMVARQRGTAINTVRAQLLTIFDKTETGSQVDLVRLLAMVSQRLNQGISGEAAVWADPLGREQIIRDRAGRSIALTWCGAPDGRPALFSHGLATGYLLPDEGLRALKERNIKLYLLSRPGFGNSDPAESGDIVQANADAVVAVAEHLGLDRWVAMGQGSGSLPLFRAQADPRSKISAILCIGVYFPFKRRMRFEDYSNTRRVALRLASASPKFAELMAKISYRSMQANGPEFIARSIYSESEVNDEVLKDPDCQALVRTAYSMLTAHKHHALTADLRLLTSDWAPDLSDCEIPVRYVHGTKDPANPIAKVDEFISTRPNMALDIVEGGGELLFFSHAKLLVESLAKLMEA